jgi:hypothetical protein
MRCKSDYTSVPDRMMEQQKRGLKCQRKRVMELSVCKQSLTSFCPHAKQKESIIHASCPLSGRE